MRDSYCMPSPTTEITHKRRLAPRILNSARNTPKRVTYILTPLENEALLPKAVDALYADTAQPFDLIVIEGNASDRVRRELEKKKAFYGDMRIIYSTFRPTAKGAYELAAPHVLTADTVIVDSLAAAHRAQPAATRPAYPLALLLSLNFARIGLHRLMRPFIHL